MKKIPVIFDSDPGLDDAFAIAYLNKCDKFDVLLLSSVAGNVELEYTSRNLRGIVKTLDWDVKIAQGQAKPVMGEQVLAKHIHGETGLQGVEFEEDELAPMSDRSALIEMIEILENSKEKVLIIAVGPLTNIATLLLARPDLKEKISEITIMGGGLKGGNTTPTAEFNIYADPEAAHIVFNSGLKINMIGLDVTEKAHYTRFEHEELKKSNEKINDLLTRIMDNTYSNRKDLLERISNLHDVVAVMFHTNPEYFKGQELAVQVEVDGRYTRGMTVADKRIGSKTEKNTLVLTDIDDEKFRKKLVEVLTK